MHGIKEAIAIACFAAVGSAPAQTSAEQAGALDAVRQYALSYTRNLPNYTCTQTTREIIADAGDHRQLRSNVVEEQISFIDKKELRKVAKINGRVASPEGPDQLANASSRGEFGNLLDLIFDPGTRADLKFDRLATLNGRRVYVFAYRVPQSRGYGLVETRRVPQFRGNGFDETKRTTQAAFKGFVYADYETRAVVRIEMKCIDIPANSAYQALELKLDYKPVKVAGGEFILPADFTLYYRLFNFSRLLTETTSEAGYTDYRRFSADAAVKFESDAQ